MALTKSGRKVIGSVLGGRFPPSSPVRLRRVLNRVLSSAALALTAAGLGGLAACSSGSGTTGAAVPAVPQTSRSTAPPASLTPTPKPPPSLPRGGRVIFPTYRVVAFYGGSDGPGLGILGQGTPDQAAAAVERQAQLYTFAGRPVQPAMELITTVALAKPGPDGVYSSRGDPAAVQRYLTAARTHKELLVLDFQPGQGNFLTQIQRFEHFVAQPDVGVAVDPEWHLQPGQIPGLMFGSSSAASINEVSSYLQAIVIKHRLPQKLFVIHQFRPSMLPDRQAILARPGLATVFHADGNGVPKDKIYVFNALAFPGPPFARGFKLFFTQDNPLMTPQQTMALTPSPDLVTYQ
jgi:hypothetical protein